MTNRIISQPFKANAHLLKLLGDELIGDDRLAIFELVKNSYDADATEVDVTLMLDEKPPRIVVKDNGSGMNLDVIKNKWLEIGTPSKRGAQRKSSLKFNRPPLGEKGVGRLAVHKLGSILKMITKEKNNKECHIEINWPQLISDKSSIDDTIVNIYEMEFPSVFLDKSHGTLIEITDLHNQDWTRGSIRNLKKMITSLVNPFQDRIKSGGNEKVDIFNVKLNVPGYERWLNDLLGVDDILSNSIWTFSFEINRDGKFIWNYKFTPPKHLMSLLPNEKNSLNGERLEVLKTSYDDEFKSEKNIFLDNKLLDGIGPISGVFYIFDRRKEILSQLPQTKLLKEYLDEQTGVRVYKDGIRVYNYGEKGDDWLGLDAARINAPAKRMGTNTVISAVSLISKESDGLIEKTNREGFDQNKNYKIFRSIIRSVVAKIDKERRDDRDKLDSSIKLRKPTEGVGVNFDDAMDKIRKSISKNKEIEKEITPQLDKLNSEYKKVKEVMLESGLSGLNLALVFHEIERELNYLDDAIKNNKSPGELKGKSSHLIELIDGFSPLLRKNSIKKISIYDLIKRAKLNNESRFKYHNIVFSSPILSKEDDDFTISVAPNLILGVIHNIIDNAIYWSRRKFENEGGGKVPAAILISNVSDKLGTNAIVIADNGPGFSITPEDAIRPFFSDKVDGIGLGLYYSNLMMEVIGGKLAFLNANELDLPKAYNGAAVVLIFKDTK
ncbi:MAG: ATP-binding protein [Morganella morganii]|nr:ATP-binding protein [Morganella morganii]MDU1073824.1 ATP-binding protein [Morganella morganii]